MNPNYPKNVKRLDDEKHEACYKETTLSQFNSKVTFKYEDEEKGEQTFTYSELCLYSSISMKNLKVTGAGNPDKQGAFSLYCKENGVGQEITIRVTVNGSSVTGKLTITVGNKGCGADLGASAAVIASVTAISAAAVCLKKKKED